MWATRRKCCRSWTQHMSPLVLKCASASRPSGEWNDDDFDVLASGQVVGRIFKANAAPVGSPRMWTLAFGHHEDRTPTHGYAATREAANRPSWRCGRFSDPVDTPCRRVIDPWRHQFHHDDLQHAR